MFFDMKDPIETWKETNELLKRLMITDLLESVGELIFQDTFEKEDFLDDDDFWDLMSSKFYYGTKIIDGQRWRCKKYKEEM